MEALIQDIAQAFRSLRRSPRFAWAVIITLALGVGAATTAFTFLNWVLLRPLGGIRETSRLGIVWFAAHPASGGYNPNGLNSQQRDFVLHASPAVEALAAYESSEPLYVSVDGNTPERTGAAFVTSDFFRALGTHTRLGRALAPDDNTPHAAHAVAVISDNLWRTKLGGRQDAVGQALKVSGLTVVVVGIAERGFRGVDRLQPTDLWLPGELYWDVKHIPSGDRPAELTYFHEVLRLKDGVTFDVAERQLTNAVKRLAIGDTADFYPGVTATVFPGIGLPPIQRESFKRQLALMMAIAGMMLLVACANVANLFLVHRARRQSEIIVRTVLGASRARLLRLHMIEGALAGVGGAATGGLLAAWSLASVRGLPLVGFIPLDTISADWRVFAFAAVAGILTALIAAAVPALIAPDHDLGGQLRGSGPTTTHRTAFLQSTLAAAQVAIAITLVAGAYLVGRTLQNFNDVPLGFDPAGVTMFSSDPAGEGYGASRVRAYRRALLTRVISLPGVESAAYVSIPPFLGMSMQAAIRLPGAPTNAPPALATEDQVSPDYFSTLRMPILRGRGFDLVDAEDSTLAPEPAVISVGLARTLFGNADAIGQTVHALGGELRVVGETVDIRYGHRGGDLQPMIYRTLARAFYDAPILVVRSHLSQSSTESEVRRAGAEIDPMVPVESKGSLEQQVEASLGGRIILFRLLSALSGITLILAAIGLYALIAYGVATRTREFGVRMALGAGARDIVRLAASGGVTIVLLGMVIGVLASLFLTRFIAALLYGVSPLDPVAIGGAVLVLGASALLASWIPARRATRVDPMVALRAE